MSSNHEGIDISIFRGVLPFVKYVCLIMYATYVVIATLKSTLLYFVSQADAIFCIVDSDNTGVMNWHSYFLSVKNSNYNTGTPNVMISNCSFVSYQIIQM